MNEPAVAEFGKLLSDLFTEVDLDTELLKLDKGSLDKHAATKLAAPDRMIQLVVNANREGWIRDLVKAVVLARPNRPEVKAFTAKYPDTEPARSPMLTNPWDTYQIPGGRLFIGRQSLRTYLKRIEQPLDKKLLIVTSTSRNIGKTYTKDLILFAAQQRPLNKVNYIDLDVEIYDAGSLARKVASDWNVDPETLPKQDKEQAARWIQHLTRFLITDSPATNGMIRWIVLDGFREKIPSLEVQEFIAQLAVAIQTHAHAAFRLVLINYTQLLPLTLRPPFSFVDVVEKITDDEIGLALTEIHGRTFGRPITPEERQKYLVNVQQRLRQHEHENPDQTSNQLLMHIAISDIVESM
jgi:Effector-associated domain 1